MRYKYSENLTEASEMTFAENEYQGIEQNGTMKRIPTTKIKQGVDNAINVLKGVGYTDGTLKTHEDRLDTLEDDEDVEGSVAHSIKTAVDPILADQQQTDLVVSDLRADYDTNKKQTDTRITNISAEVQKADEIYNLGSPSVLGTGTASDWATPVVVEAKDGDMGAVLEGKLGTNLLGTQGDMASNTLWVANFGSETIGAYEANTTNPISGNRDARLTVTTAGSSSTNPQLYNLYNRLTFVAGHVYTVAFDYKVNSGTAILNRSYDGTGIVMLDKTFSGSGRYLFKFTCAANNANTGNLYFDGRNLFNLQIDNVEIQDLTALGLATLLNTTAKAQAYFTYHTNTLGVGEMRVRVTDGTRESITYTPPIGFRLPNMVADSFDLSTGVHTKRVQRYVLQSADISALTNVTNTQYATILTATLSGIVATSTTVAPTYAYVILSDGSTRYPVISSGGDVVGGEIYFYATGASLRLNFALGTYANLAAAQAALAGTVIYYQLDTPIITQYDTQHLQAFSSGTMYIEPAKRDGQIYNNGLTFDKNVLSVDTLYKFVAGEKIAITSFTITNNVVTSAQLSNGDICRAEVTFKADQSLVPVSKTKVPYFNLSKLMDVLKGGATGQVLKKKSAVDWDYEWVTP